MELLNLMQRTGVFYIAACQNEVLQLGKSTFDGTEEAKIDKKNHFFKVKSTKKRAKNDFLK